MRFLDIIEKKKDKKELTREEIQFWIDGVVREEIPEYQSSALLMAIVLNGMSERETVDLTMIMRDSGDVYDLSLIAGIKADKHSTGGVGDKTTLALGPLVASQGVKIAKMSGRGLGHTGGTLDKLESIPGYRIALSNQELIDQVNRIGIAVIGQSDTSVPADKKLYALRDVTATVESIPLIASSMHHVQETGLRQRYDSAGCEGRRGRLYGKPGGGRNPGKTDDFDWQVAGQGCPGGDFQHGSAPGLCDWQCPGGHRSH